MDSLEFRKRVKKSSFVICVVLIIFIIFLMLYKYEVEGENKEKLPFLIKSISIVSTADGTNKEKTKDFLWTGKLIQTNDIYVNIKNNNSKKILENVTIENIEIKKAPEIGTLIFSNISKNKDSSNLYLTEESLEKLVYKADTKSSLEKLTIANNGGTVGLRIMNTNLGEYKTNEETINYDGRMLAINNIVNEKLKFNIHFDIVIKVKDDIEYYVTVNTELPKGNIVEKGTELVEYKDINNFVYKRK